MISSHRSHRNDVAAKVLETERLVLRLLRASDAEFILELLNEPAFIRNIGDRGVRTIGDARFYIAAGPVASYERFGFGLYLVELKSSGIPAGICGLLKRDFLEDVDIGFAFLQKFWSNGYAHESASAVFDYGRDVLALPRVVAIAAPDNEGSIKVLRKIGLRFQRTLRVPGRDGETNLFSS